MTAPLLLAWICAAIGLQLLIGLGVAIWRHRPATAEAPTDTTAPHPAPAWAGWRSFRVAARHWEDPSHSQCSFHLVPEDGLALPTFYPGQFLTFALKVALPEGGLRPVTRCYSLSDQPHPDHYRVTIKRVPAPPDRPQLAPGLSSTHFHDHVQVGDVLHLRAPAGHFHIDPQDDAPVVLIGGGIGITPMMSMLLWCLHHQPHRPVHLFYGLRNQSEHAFKPELEALAQAHPQFKLHVVYSRPGPHDVLGSDFQHTGHVTVALLREHLPHGRHQFYLCGPGPLMNTLVPALHSWGVPESDVHHEAFGPAAVQPGAPAPAAPDASPVDVQFKRSGRTLDWRPSDGSLLAFAEAHGIALDSGCRSGGCGCCQTRVLRGQVHYAQRPDHTPAAGHCLPCVGTPGGALVLDA